MELRCPYCPADLAGVYPLARHLAAEHALTRPEAATLSVRLSEGSLTYVQRERAQQVRWKQSTPTLPEQARVAAPAVLAGGRTTPRTYPFCLPIEHAALNLLPDPRVLSVPLFAELGIPWHHGINGGPCNHLLSSQVQCVNALAAAVTDASRVQRAFGQLLPIDTVEQIEPGRWLTFEYNGRADYLGEGNRTRGAMSTSADAAIRYATADGRSEIALIEWKYTEHYLGIELRGTMQTRHDRYRALWAAGDSPVRRDLIPYEDLFVEPFYQLFRQQLLARAMERAGEADRVRVVHVSPAANTDLARSMNRDSHRFAGATVFDAWRSMVLREDDFLTMDSAVFADAALTEPEYVARYGH